MSVYFTASIVGKKQYLKNYLAILDALRKRNLKVISDHIIKSTEEEIRLEKKEDRLTFQGKLEKWIGNCKFMVVESSFPSISVGYEISLALQFNKPVLILYADGDPPSLLVHHEDDKIVCEKYSLSTLDDIVEDFVNYADEQVDTRFTFFVTPEISVFLDKIARREKLPKAVYLRRLIKKDMTERGT